MESIISEFIKSDKTESEFFGVDATNSMTLIEYLALLESVDERFQNFIVPEVDSIKEKLDWVSGVNFNCFQCDNGVFIDPAYNIYAEDINGLIAVQDRYTHEYKELTKPPKLYMISKRVRTLSKRQEDLALIQEELKKINEVATNVYNGYLYTMHSVSGNFDFHYRPGEGMLVGTKKEVLATYYKPFVKSYDNPVLTQEEQNDILNRVQVRSRTK